MRGGGYDEISEEKVNAVKAQMQAFCALLQQPKADFKTLLELHVRTAEKLAAQPGETGVTVRPKYGTHPRLRILGPIEARLTHFDTIIVGEVNEGAFPKASGADPWMSRPMKRDFGFPLPEKVVGVLAHDFCQLLAADRVYLTRAERVQGTPMVKSRWCLESVLKALGADIAGLEDEAFKSWADFIDRAEVFSRLPPPEPRPPVEARPRVMSASAVENWMRDPYIIYAKYILKLKKLDELEQDLSLKDYGTIIHAVLEQPSSGGFSGGCKSRVAGAWTGIFCGKRNCDGNAGFLVADV